MADFETPMIKLLGLSSFLEQQRDLDESLKEMANMAAGLLDSRKCSIMLFYDQEDGDPVMKLHAGYGDLDPSAYTEKAHNWEGIAGYVAATGKALLVRDIEQSPFAEQARWPECGSRSFISAPIFIGPKVLGVINVTAPIDGRIYSEKDLYLLTTAALVTGKSIHVLQLQNLLHSRFAQLALLQETQMTVEHAVATAIQSPARTAKVFGRAFYREMRKAGFTDSQIINAATEIIGQLGDQVESHRHRLQKED